MTLLLVVEINIHIHHVFQRRKGNYFWAMQIGSLGCLVDVIALLVRNFVPHSVRVWPLYTFLATVSWAVYTVAQLVILYSRLHLVLRSLILQRCIFLAIVIVSPVLIITDWIVVWPAWNPSTSQHWSVATAIVERIAQLGFSIIEVSINVVYAVCLVKMLRLKSSVRQRRVMWDLIYVNALAVAFDILNIVLAYVNRVGISRPIQTFTYALKLRLEFIVLNQLMAVAARKLQRETFGERRYNRSPKSDNHWSSGQVGKKLGIDDTLAESVEKRPSDASDRAILEVAAPAPIALKESSSSIGANPSESKSRPLQSNPIGGSAKQSPHSMVAIRRQSLNSTKTLKSPVIDKALPASPTRKARGLRKNDDDEPEEDTIGLHEWERKARPILEVPWLPRSIDL